MNFASKFGYNYGFDRSSSEEMSDEEEKTQKKIKRRIRKADTNFISVQFQKLVIPNQMHAGDPLKCKNCEAFVSHLSRIDFQKKPILWECDFCLTVNDLTKHLFDKNQLPNVDDVSYLIEPAPEKKEEVKDPKRTGDENNNKKSTDDNFLTFCMDISGSMDTKIKRQQLYASRLDAVKAACAENVLKLKNEEPNKRVSLVTFSDNIKYYGDCTLNQDMPLVTISEPSYQETNYNSNRNVPIRTRLLNFVTRSKPSSSTENVNPRDILNNLEGLLDIGKKQNADLKAIKDSHKSLENKLKMLRTEGSTALGPALAFSVGFLTNKPGSQIILCTDGCANVGIGSLSYSRQYSSNNNESNNNENKFYDDIAEYAYSKSITINVISIEGTDCKLSILGKLTDKTNGNLNIVNPENLSEEFRSILDNRIIATNVKAKLYVFEKFIYLRDEKVEEEEAKLVKESRFDDEKARDTLDRLKKSVLEKQVGNATLDTQITFEYGIRRIKEAKVEKSELKSLPFQLQISYTAPDGSKAVRVYTKLQEFTSDRKQAEECVIDKKRIITNAQQNISNQILKENVFLAKYRSKASNNLMLRNQIDVPLSY